MAATETARPKTFLVGIFTQPDVRRALALVLCAVVGFGAACSSGKDKSRPGAHLPPPQPTTGKTGTPSTPSNTDRTTTSAPAG